MSLPYLPTQLWIQVPFGDQDAFEDWMLSHFLTHVALAAKTNTPLSVIDNLRQQMMPHAQMHQDVASALKIATNYDFADYDLKDQDSYYEFMLAHASHHAQLTSSAGL